MAEEKGGLPALLLPAIPMVGVGIKGRDLVERFRAVAIQQPGFATDLAEVVRRSTDRTKRDQFRRMAAAFVFAYWVAKLEHFRAELDPLRENLICQRLLECQDDVSTMLYVVDGAKKDDWTMGRNPRAPSGLDAIKYLFADRETVEKHAERCREWKDGKPHPMAVAHGFEPSP